MDRLLWDGATAAAQRQLAFVSPARAADLRGAARDADARADAATLAAMRSAIGAQRRRASSPIARAGCAIPARASRRAQLARPARARSPRRRSMPRNGLEMLLDSGARRRRRQPVELRLRHRQAGRRRLSRRHRRRATQPLASATIIPVSPGSAAGRAQAARPPARRDAAVRALRARRADRRRRSRKGYYWAGRAAEPPATQARASRISPRAAAIRDQFYGQLAAERLGRPLAAPQPHRRRRSIPPIARRIRQSRAGPRRADARRARRLAGPDPVPPRDRQTAKTDDDHVLAAEFAREIGRPDLGVMVGAQRARERRRRPISRAGFPDVAGAVDRESHWTMIHAISRQESQFDRAARSAMPARAG